MTFPDDGAPLSWAALRDAVATGLVDVGLAHAHARAARPAAAGPRSPTSSTGRSSSSASAPACAPAHFAYPKAVPGSPAADAARARPVPLGGARGHPREPLRRTDPYRLARSPMQVQRRHALVPSQGRRRPGFEDTLRRLLNRGRYASATT